MENLTLEEQPPPPPPPSQGGSQAAGPSLMGLLGAGAAPAQNQQLPPQMFTTAAQLLDLTDKKLMVSLRDGRKLIGVLRSWDQFANIVLQATVERIFVPPPSTSQPGLYADVPRGIFLVRGENVLLLGEIDLDKDDDPPPGFEKAEVEVVHQMTKERKAKEARKDKVRLSKLRQLGFEGEASGETFL